MASSNLRAIGLMTGGMAAFAVADLMIKFAGATLSSAEILLVMGIGGTLVFALITRARGEAVLSRGFLHPVVVMRNIAEVLGAGAMISAITLAPLSLVTAIAQATPLFVTLGAAIMLRERVGPLRWSAVVLGLVGVLVMLRPGTAEISPGALLALLGVVFLALRDLSSRRVPAGISTFQLGTWGFAVLAAAGAVRVALAGGMSAPDRAGLLLTIVATLAGAGAYYLVTAAMRSGEAAAVAPFRYTRLVFAFTLAYAVLGERPDFATISGATIVLAAGLFVLMREADQRRRARAAASIPGGG